MKTTFLVTCGLMISSAALAGSNDFRCFQSVGLRKPIKLQFSFPTEESKMNQGHVRYQRGSDDIPVKRLTIRDLYENTDSKPEYEAIWQELVTDGGKYLIRGQGALIYSLTYIRKKDGRSFEFQDVPEAYGEKGCSWE